MNAPMNERGRGAAHVRRGGAATFSLNDRLIRIYLSCRLLTGAGLIAVTEFPLKFASARSCGKLSFLSRKYKRFRNTFKFSGES